MINLRALWAGTGRRRFSPLTMRVLAVNALALAVLAGSLLYVGQYKERLIDSELNALALEARIFAGAIAEGATIMNRDGSDMLAPSLARLMVRRLAEASDAHTRLFLTNGTLIADSHALVRPKERVDMEPLTPPDAEAARDQSSFSQHIWRNLWPWFVIDTDRYPLYTPIDATTKIDDYPEIAAARDGAASTRVWRTKRGGLLFSAAMPIQRYKQVLGMLNLTRGGNKIETAITAVQIDILRFFFAALTVTTLLSFYLARTITRPVLRLAAAAERVRGGIGPGRDQAEIPDFTGRGDEIGDLSGALRDMTADLRARIDAIEHFAADVAHELKNPLTSMRSAIETIGRVKDDAVRDKLLAIVLDDTGRLDRLISDISNASRLDAELSRAELTTLDLDRLLATLVGYYGHHGVEEDKGAAAVSVHYTHTISTLAAPALTAPALTADGAQPDSAGGATLIVRGVESRLAQVFRNLIDNAISFSPAGGRVLVESAHGEEPGTAIVTVDDWGPGIPEASLEAIFERFYSERPAGEKFGMHSGLGLSISKQIIDAHRGRIFAANRHGDDGRILGARFTVILPLAS